MVLRCQKWPSLEKDLCTRLVLRAKVLVQEDVNAGELHVILTCGERSFNDCFVSERREHRRAKQPSRSREAVLASNATPATSAGISTYIFIAISCTTP